MTYLMMISTYLRNLRQDEKGVTALEYALMGALVAGGIVVATSGLATAISNEFGVLAGKIYTAAG